MPHIYASNFFLNYNNKKIADKYLDLLEPIVRLGNKVIIPILSLISFTIIVLIGANHKHFMNESHSTSLFVFYITILGIYILLLVIDLILLALVFLFRIGRDAQQKVAYVVYTILSFHFILMQIMMESLFKVKVEYCFWVNIVEYIVKVNMHFIGIVEFHPSFYIHLIIPIVSIGLFFEINGINTIIFDSGITFIILNLGLIMSSHLITRIRKNNLYYLFMLNISNNLRENILNYLNTGFLSVEGGKIEFINHSLKTTLLKSKYVKTHQKAKEEVNANHSEVIFDIIFNWTIQQLSPVTEENAIIPKPIDIFQGTLIKVKELFKQNDNANMDACQFVFLCHATLELEAENSSANSNEQSDGNNKLTYEIFCNFDGGDQFEFIFNDITRTREAEKKENDCKIQSVFLTKVAHEFKNPLICIQELSAQIKEKIFSLYLSLDNKNGLSRNCSLIASIVEYLLIRIKDLDYFISNETEVSGSNQTVFEKIELKGIIDFCYDIANAKLEQTKKDESIKLNTVIPDSMPRYIYSDCIKIKQILSQLISNAVKYTERGVVSFEIEKDKNSLTFIIKDTGEGLSYEAQRVLSDKEPFKKGSACVGLSLIRKLTKQIGKRVQYATKKDEGTSFWFSIPFGKDQERNEVKSIDNIDSSDSLNKTIKLDTIELEMSTIFPTSSTYNIICADDEELARKALIRVMKSTAKSMNININVIEASDGTEILRLIYKHYYTKDSNPIHAIISDQKMNFLNGSMTQNILINLTNLNRKIPFFIVSAFNNNARYFIETKCTDIFTKPLKKSDVKTIIDLINKPIVL